MSIATALEELSTRFGPQFTQAQAMLAEHSQNETYFENALPDAVIFVESTQDVSDALRICNEHECPVVPYAAASALEGQHLAIQGGVSLDMNRMNKVLSINSEDLNVVLQPGVTREQLNQELRATGLFFPIDPGANATLGGMAATRASGTTAVRFGTMRDNVLALEAVMADGTVIRTGSQARKSSTGYDLTHLMVGSEGTLGVFTELTLRLQGIPEATTAATCRFDSVEDAVNTVILTIQSGIPMARIELIDEQMVTGFNRHSKSDLPEKPHLFIEFQGTLEGVKEQATSFGDIAEEFGADTFQWAEKTEERAALWKMRHSAHYAMTMLEPGKRTLSTDVCVPISKLAEAVGQAQMDRERLGLLAPIVGHVGDGNFHCGVRCNPEDPEEMARVAEFTSSLAETALRLGGTVSGEHGIGIGKMKYMQAEHGPAIAYMRAIKSSFDPKGIMNPGKMLPPGN